MLGLQISYEGFYRLYAKWTWEGNENERLARKEKKNVIQNGWEWMRTEWKWISKNIDYEMPRVVFFAEDFEEETR